LVNFYHYFRQAIRNTGVLGVGPTTGFLGKMADFREKFGQNDNIWKNLDKLNFQKIVKNNLQKLGVKSDLVTKNGSLLTPTLRFRRRSGAKPVNLKKLG